MPKKVKLSLLDLKVSSFKTSLNEDIKGGSAHRSLGQKTCRSCHNCETLDLTPSCITE